MAAVKELWNRCMVIMEQKLQNPVSMDVWLKQIRPVEITGEKATLSVPSAFYWEIIRAKFYNVIKSSLEEAIGFPIALAGCFGYIVNGWNAANLPPYSFGYIYLPSLFGIVIVSMFTAPLGARLAQTLPVPKLKKCFALLLIVIGIRMLLKAL